MKKEKACYIVGITTVVLTVLMSALLDVVDLFDQLQWVCSVLIFPIILYISYWHCKKSKLKSFIIAFINDYFCIFFQLALYHISTGIDFWNDGIAMLLFSYFFGAKFIISAIALLIYIFKEREWTFKE